MHFHSKQSQSACAPFAGHPPPPPSTPGVSLAIYATNLQVNGGGGGANLNQPTNQPEAAFFNVISVGYRPASHSACRPVMSNACLGFWTIPQWQAGRRRRVERLVARNRVNIPACYIPCVLWHKLFRSGE